MPVPGDDLRRRDGTQPERVADVFLHERVDVGVGADGTRELADRDAVARAEEPRPVAVDLQAPERELDAEGRGFGVHAVRATRHGGGYVLGRAGLQHPDQPARRGDQQVGGTDESRAQRGVDHVRRREPVVDPRTFRGSDLGLHDVDERSEVVVGDSFASSHVRYELRRHLRCPGPDRLCGGRRDDTDRRPAVHGGELHLEPARQPRLVGEEDGHLGKRVTGYQSGLPESDASASSAAMS